MPSNVFCLRPTSPLRTSQVQPTALCLSPCQHRKVHSGLATCLFLLPLRPDQSSGTPAGKKPGRWGAQGPLTPSSSFLAPLLRPSLSHSQLLSIKEHLLLLLVLFLWRILTSTSTESYSNIRIPFRKIQNICFNIEKC